MTSLTPKARRVAEWLDTLPQDAIVSLVEVTHATSMASGTANHALLELQDAGLVEAAVQTMDSIMRWWRTPLPVPPRPTYPNVPPAPPSPPPVLAHDIDAMLEERGKRYGGYVNHADVTQAIKAAVATGMNWTTLPPYMRETFDMVAHKMGRILNGDPKYLDSWDDMIGYIKLVIQELELQGAKRP